MGALLRRLGRLIKRLLEGGVDAIRVALRAARRVLRDRTRRLEEAARARDQATDPRLRRVYEELVEQYQREADEAAAEVERLRRLLAGSSDDVKFLGRTFSQIAKTFERVRSPELNAAAKSAILVLSRNEAAYKRRTASVRTRRPRRTRRAPSRKTRR